jgi:predicted methyltransferase MtxX (methanogen marker protein 4)
MPDSSCIFLFSSLSSNRNLHLDTSLDVDNDLLDDLGRRRQVDQALVDAHLVAVPRLGTLTAGRLAGLLPVRAVHRRLP